MNKILEPAKTFSSIYGTDKIFIGRSSPNATRWLPEGELALDMLSGGMLTVLGGMPVVCAVSASTPPGLDLLRDAGFQLPSTIVHYNGTAEYLSVIRRICAEGATVVTQHVHPEKEVPRENLWIDPAALSFVNNKASLYDLVPACYRPDRDIVPVSQLAANERVRCGPVVIKAVTDESTGGGVDVRICRNEDDLPLAVEYFSDCSRVVVEEYLDISRNLCLNYDVTGGGEIDFLGFADQVSDDRGIYRGNWIESGMECPPTVAEVGRNIVRSAFDRGYWGFLGIDIALLANGECKVFDLNFRANGSTPAVLLAESVYRRFDRPVMRLRRFSGTDGYRQLLQAARQAMNEEIFLPLGSCDPSAGPYPNERPLMTGLILGQTRFDVLENERKLMSLGMEI
jgi:hypothetical protein